MKQVKNVTKDDLAQGLVDNETVGISKAQAINAVNDILASVQVALMQGGDITIRNFGTLKVVERKAKLARNIKAGTRIIIPAYKTVKFIPSKQLKNSVNNGNK